MRSLLSTIMVLSAFAAVEAGEKTGKAMISTQETRPAVPYKHCPLCETVQVPGIVRLVSPSLTAPAPTVAPLLRPASHGLLQFSFPATSPHLRANVYPAAPPLPSAPPTAAPSPFAPFQAYRRLTQVYRLRNQSAASVAAKIQAHVQECVAQPFGTSPVPPSATVIVVPETNTNSLIVSAPGIVMEKITAHIAKLDRSPKQYRVDIVITKTDHKTGKTVLSRPQIITFAGQKASISVGSSRESLEVELRVTEIKQNAGVTSKRQHSQKKITQRRLPAYNVFATPKPRALTAKPRTAPVPDFGVSPRYQPPQPRRIQLTGGAIPQPIPHHAYAAAPIDRPAPAPLSVKTYAISGLLKNCQGATVVEFVRAAVLPQSWKHSRNRCTVLFFNATSSLVVRQSTAGHRQIAELLRELRKTRAAGPTSAYPSPYDQSTSGK